MYGLVNQGIKDLVVNKFGNKAWETICADSGSPTEFISMHYYDDQITYKLVGAASKLLSLPPEKILNVFGQHWVQYTANEGYGSLMDLFGSDLKSCLQNLNHLHTRMGMSMPQLRPPSFLFQEIDKNTFVLTYKSERKGLGPMVQGLVEGLAKKFGNTVRVTELTVEEGHDQKFKIELLG